jgi:hypothetical protein
MQLADSLFLYREATFAPLQGGHVTATATPFPIPRCTSLLLNLTRKTNKQVFVSYNLQNRQ